MTTNIHSHVLRTMKSASRACDCCGQRRPQEILGQYVYSRTVSTLAKLSTTAFAPSGEEEASSWGLERTSYSVKPILQFECAGGTLSVLHPLD